MGLREGRVPPIVDALSSCSFYIYILGGIHWYPPFSDTQKLEESFMIFLLCMETPGHRSLDLLAWAIFWPKDRGWVGTGDFLIAINAGSTFGPYGFSADETELFAVYMYIYISTVCKIATIYVCLYIYIIHRQIVRWAVNGQISYLLKL